MIMPIRGSGHLSNRPKKVHFALFPYVIEIPARGEREEVENILKYVSNSEITENMGKWLKFK